MTDVMGLAGSDLRFEAAHGCKRQAEGALLAGRAWWLCHSYEVAKEDIGSLLEQFGELHSLNTPPLHIE